MFLIPNVSLILYIYIYYINDVTEVIGEKTTLMKIVCIKQTLTV